METKNSILARQKEMQLSLDKVKHLVRLIQAFSFTQALAETEGKDRVQDGSESSSVEKAKATSPSPHAGSDGGDEQERHAVAAGNQTAAAGDAVQEDGPVPAADTGPDVGSQAGGGANTGTSTQAEVVAQPEAAAAPEESATTSATPAVATTNGTTEPSCTERSPAGDAAAAAATATNSEKKMAETAVEKEEVTDSDGSNSNNSKTSEPSQQCSPALLSSLDNRK